MKKVTNTVNEKNIKTSSLTWREWIEILAHFQDLVHLGLLSANEVTQLVAEMHGKFGAIPQQLFVKLMGGGDTRKLPQLSRVIYKVITGSLLGVASVVNKLNVRGVLVEGSSEGVDKGFSAEKPPSRLEAHVNWRRFQAALNGVAGDKLQQWDNNLATPMSFRKRDGTYISVETINANDKNLIVFIHGLCNSEWDWQNEQHLQTIQAFEQQNYQVVWLRYNTGLAIYNNGEQLHTLLKTLDLSCKQLVLIGHSMGGLIMRAAYEQETAQLWLSALVKAAYIGTPHHGAPMERLGENANRLLALSPFIQPLMRLGNIRSQGIKDLRYGYIDQKSAEAGVESTYDERDTVQPLPAQCQHLLIGSTLNNATQNKFLGDGLVPLTSALGEHEKHDFIIHAEQIDKQQYENMDHLAQLKDVRIYDALRPFVLVK